MPIKKKVYAVYFIKRTKGIAILTSSEEYAKEIKYKLDAVYDRGDELVFRTRDISEQHIKETFKTYFTNCFNEIMNVIDNYKGE